MKRAFQLEESPRLDSCAHCSSKENIKTLVIPYYGGFHWLEIQLCKDCRDKLKSVLESEDKE